MSRLGSLKTSRIQGRGVGRPAGSPHGSGPGWPVGRVDPCRRPTHRRPTAGHPLGRPRVGFTALRKDAGLCCGSHLRKGEVFAYVGRIHNLKDLKGRPTPGQPKWAHPSPVIAELGAILSTPCGGWGPNSEWVTPRGPAHLSRRLWVSPLGRTWVGRPLGRPLPWSAHSRSTKWVTGRPRVDPKAV